MKIKSISIKNSPEVFKRAVIEAEVGNTIIQIPIPPDVQQCMEDLAAPLVRDIVRTIKTTN